MRKLLLLLVLSLIMPVVSRANEAVYYVSPDGNDSASGTLSAPFATIEKGLSVIQTRRKTKEVDKTILYLRGGRHYVSRTINIREADAGTPAAPLIISAWKDEKPVVVGGLPVTQWKRGHNGTLTANLSGLPITLPVRCLNLDDQRLIWARYPNFDPEYPYSGGWAYVDGTPFNMYKDVEGESVLTIVQKENDVRNWQNPQEGMVSIFPRHNWSNNVNNIESFDAKTRTITLKQRMRYAARPADRYCVLGMKEELDAPGEWYFDSANKQLTMIPPNGDTFDSLQKKNVTIALVDRIFALEKTKHVTISGLTMTCANECAVSMYCCDDCKVEKSTIHDLGFKEGAVSLYKGTHCSIYGCDLYNLGAGAILFTNVGEFWTLQESGHVAENNYIHHTGVYFKCNSPISVNGVGVRVSRNTIHDIPRTPISFTGAKIVIEYNDLRISNLESEDSGAIYSNGAGSWINNHGCTIRGNWVRDSIGFGHKLGKYQFYMFTWGIYLDDTSGGLDVYDNIVQRCTIGCMHLHNARDNQIYNNIFSDGGDRQYQLSGWSNDPNGRMMKRHFTTMVRNYEKAVQCPEWRALRGMDVHPKDAFLPDGSSMSGDHIFNNIFYYPNQPETPYISHRLFNFKYNEIDRNLVWNGGTSPIRTGMTGIQKIVASLNDKVINLDFAKTDAEHFPDHWKWYQKTRPDARAEVIGPKTLRIHEAWNPEKVNVKTATLRNDSLFNLEPGKSYRIRFSYSGEHADAPAAARVVTESKGFWRAMGVTNSIPGKSGTAESVFRVPKPGEDHYDARIGQFAFHLVYYGKTGYIDIGSVQLEEVVPSTEWEAWQQQGIDVHSVVADPEFVDATHDDFTLKPTSPALKLGFKQIDRKKIGVYDDPRRATFPIVEAEGVREHPEWLRIPESKEVRKESK